MNPLHSKPSAEYFPMGIFAMTMGLFGLAIAWQKAVDILDWPRWVACALLFVSMIVFVVLLYFFIKKALFYFVALRTDFAHPIRIGFFPALSISFILLGTALLPMARNIGFVFWLIGSLLHIIFTLSIIHVWITGNHFEIKHLNPVWFIPAVGNVIVPVAGVHYAPLDVLYFFFAIGMFFWVILLVLLFYRLFFYPPLPEKLQPTLFILLAPPALALIAYMHLAGGQVDFFAHLLYGFALFTFLLLLTFIPRLARLPFYLSWWAYSFPLAALVLASFSMYSVSYQAIYLNIAVVLLVVLSLVVAMLLAYTLNALKKGKIGLPED